MNAKTVFIIFLLLGLLSACNISEPNPSSSSGELSTAPATSLPFDTSSPPTPYPESSNIPPVTAEMPVNQVVLNRAFEAASALKTQNLAALSALVHPVSGLRFTAYSYVNDTDLVFSAEQVAALPADSQVYTWGEHAGSGEPISFSFPGYYVEFIYDLDFINAPRISLNQRLSIGSTLDNSAEFYPGSMIVEFHYPGVDPQYEGMDWRSLRLVFSEYNGSWYLVGLIHDEWTP